MSVKWGAFRNLFAKAAPIMKYSVSQTSARPIIREHFPTWGILLPVAPVQLNPDSLKSDPSMYRSTTSDFSFTFCGLLVTAGYFPFSVVAIHLHSLVHDPSRRLTRRWVGYVSSHFEDSCVSRYVCC